MLLREKCPPLPVTLTGSATVAFETYSGLILVDSQVT